MTMIPVSEPHIGRVPHEIEALILKKLYEQWEAKETNAKQLLTLAYICKSWKVSHRRFCECVDEF
jgi:hypothetical protein